MREFGEVIGLAFQIKDDLFDYGTSSIGKPKGIDIKEKKMTLPLIHALAKADKKKKNHIIRSIRKRSTDPDVVHEVITFVKESGGLEYASQVMKEYKAKALSILDGFKDSEAKESLRILLEYVIEREK